MDPVFLFPGQGAYDGPALALARDRHPQVGAVVADIDPIAAELFGRKLSDELLGATVPDAAALFGAETWVSQLAIYASSVAAHRILADAGVDAGTLVGHSLGEIAALVAAGTYTVADGARIVSYRLQVVAELDLPPGRMVALSTGPARARAMAEVLDDPEVAVAAENSDRQTVVSGPQRSLGRLLGIARHLDVGAAELAAPYPFHSPMLAPAVPALAARIERLPRARAELPVYSPILGRAYEPDGSLAEALASHLVRPVRFAAAVRELHAAGNRRFVEVGGLTALSRLVRHVLAEQPEVSTWATFTVESTGELALDATVAALGAGRPGDPAALAAALGADPEQFAAFWDREGPEIVRLVRDRLAAFARSTPAAAAPPAPEQTAPPASPPTQPGAPDRATLAADVRAAYAAALEYPEEVFGDDVRLEAELGIDSVKQMELLTRMSERYGLPERAGVRLSDYDTLAKIVDLLQGELAAA